MSSVSTHNSNVNDAHDNAQEDAFDDIDTGYNSPAGTPDNSDVEEIVSLKESILAGKGRTKLAPASNSKLINVDSTRDPRIFTIANVAGHHNSRSVHKIVLATSKISGCKVRKGFNNTWHIYCKSVEDVAKAVAVRYSIGDVASVHGAILYYYRVLYVADEVKADHGDRIVQAFQEQYKIKVLSTTINEEKKCVSIYLGNCDDFSFLTSSPNGDEIKVKGTSAFHGTYYLHSVRSCATTNDPNISKFQVNNVPGGYEEDTFLEVIKETCAPIIPPKNIIGLSIYRYPDTNRNANFGFVHVAGSDAAEILERVEVPIPGCRTFALFERAKEGENKRKREE